MSEKSQWYEKKRNGNSKSGSRTFVSGDQEKANEGYDRIFGSPKCTVCGVEVLKGRVTCDSCQELSLIHI